MKTRTKTGLTLAGVHTFVVLVAVLVTGGYGIGSSYPVWWLLLSADFPAVLLLLFGVIQVPEPEILDRAIFFALFLGILGGAWWFSIGWLVAALAAAESARIRFASGLVITTVVVSVVLAAQFIATVDRIASDGCAIAGFPLPFFRGCYGTLSLYWPAMSVSKAALALDAFVWIVAGLVFSSYLVRKKRAPARRNDGARPGSQLHL